MAVHRDVISVPHTAPIVVVQHKERTRLNCSVVKHKRNITICASLLTVVYLLLWSALRESPDVPKTTTRAMSTQPDGVWDFGDLAPASTWQFDAEALNDVRKYTAKLTLQKRTQEVKLGKVQRDSAIPFGHYYNTCAVIGNSGVLLGSGCGKEIDSMDYVIRIDLPVISGFEKDVGRRTNMTVLNHRTPTRMERSSQMKNRSEDVYDSRMKDAEAGVLLSDPRAQPQIAKALGVYNLSFSLLKLKGGIKDKINKIASSVAKKKMKGPTIGLISVLMMTTFCNHSHMYGFFPYFKDVNNKPIRYHYYPNDRVYPPLEDNFDPRAHHDTNKEYEFHRDLHRRGVLKMHLGQCGDP
ncbi:hypothetical protein Bbelb_417760 [Branchiostoma belcheri]|nr:hypothetical protein Bbelb_417760 [Branchiostoma belcheri]